jgi:p-methyltransferase
MAGPLQLASLESLRRELRYLRAQGVTTINFIDDTFNVPLPRFKALCRMLIEERFGISWYSMFRCANADEETFDLMAESGCRGVFLGIESGSQAVLTAMRKAARVDRYVYGIGRLRDRGIATLASFIVGFPGETRETVLETAAFIAETQPTFYRAQLYYHDTRLPIQQEAEPYQLVGAAYSWRHRTMDWREAADWVEFLYRTVQGPTIFPAYGFDLESLPYLTGQEFSFEQVTRFARLAHEMLVRTLDEPVLDTTQQEQALLALFAPPT